MATRPCTVRYNTGLHISQNGRALAEQLEELVQAWPVPVEEICIVGYSMGGLVARSALHYGAQAKHSWLGHTHKTDFYGHTAPRLHGGAGGNMIDLALEVSPYSVALSRLGPYPQRGHHRFAPRQSD
jgi:triacylglycerol esterase/lipase EstA (alpha/beta hydrolase family)